MRQKLTDLTIRGLPHPDSGSVKYWDTVTRGFGVRVTTGRKSFFVMYGKERRLHTIGHFPEIGLKAARDEAKRYLVLKPVQKPAMSLMALQEAFLEHCEASLRYNTTRRYRAALKKTPAEATSPHEIAAYKAMYNWGLRNGLVDANPFQHKQAIFKKRDRVLTDDEIKRLWQHDRPPFSTIVKLLVLTGQRRSQFATFDQSWIVDAGITFPSILMKSKRTHTIPLTQWSAALVAELKPFNGWGKSKARLDQEANVHDWVIHDLRRFFSTTMAKLGVPLHITEHLLDHRSSTSGVQAVYMQYGFLPEMRQALEIYEKHIHSLIAGPS